MAIGVHQLIGNRLPMDGSGDSKREMQDGNCQMRSEARVAEIHELHRLPYAPWGLVLEYFSSNRLITARSTPVKMSA